MSRRSILLATTMCMGLASAAAIAPASAHGGGGGGFGGGGSFHSAGSGNFSHGPELAPAHTGTMTSSAEHVRAIPVSKTVAAPFGLATRHTLTGQVPAPIYTGSIALSAKGQKIPASAFPPADPSPNSPIGPAPTVLKPVGPGVKVNKGGAPAPWLWVPAVPY